MKPYYDDGSVTLYHGDSRELVGDFADAVVVTDPPYNVGYHYATYGDRLEDGEYLHLISVTARRPSVVIHYPEDQFRIAARLGVPEKLVAWVYNANTPRQFRLIAWYGVKPDLELVKQPYKNPTDPRVRALVERGSEGRSLYDWWHVDQVKNVSAEKLDHPCQIPLDVMRRVVGITPGDVILDPFAGSGTTLRAAKDAGRRAIGIEMDERYCEMAALRLGQETLGLSA